MKKPPYPTVEPLAAMPSNRIAEQQTRLAVSAYWEAVRREEAAESLRDADDVIPEKCKDEQGRWHRWLQVAWDALSKVEDHVIQAIYAWDAELWMLSGRNSPDYKHEPRGVIVDG